MTASHFSLTKELAHELFDYRDGVLYWKKSLRYGFIGKAAGTQEVDGYLVTQIKGKRYKNHRIIYLMHTGKMPPLIDHIDMNPSNNRIENLRPATVSQNGMNSTTRRHSRSQIKNVRWHHNAWIAYITVDGKQKHLGSFKDAEIAELVAIEAREKWYGEFARHS